MKILILTIEYPPIGGGASPVIHEINKQFLAKGHEVAVVTMAHKKANPHEYLDGVDVHRIKCFRMHHHMSYLWEHIAFIWSAKRFLKKFIPSSSFDVCYTHFLVPSGILARWVNKKFGIPYVITAHGSDIPGFNPDRFNNTHRMTPRLIRSIMERSTWIVSPSNYLSELMSQMNGIPADKIVRIPNGIDTQYFQPGSKRPIILSSGRLLERKGFQHLIEAVSYEALPVEVHICGDGPMMKSLREQADKSLTPVIFHGWVSNRSEHYKKLLAEASIFCLVSSKENASIVLLEALASGCAVITSDVAGCPESVGDAGICIPPGQSDRLNREIKKLLNEKEYSVNLMKAGRERAVREFAWPAIAERYLSLFEKQVKG